VKELDVRNWTTSDWVLCSYRLRLRKPIAARGATANIRRGLLVIKKHPWGMGFGEAAPIPGFHPIEYMQVQEELILALQQPEKIVDCSAITTCALEMASWQKKPINPIFINGLLTNSGNIDPQFSCYKIKVGRASIQEELSMLSHISSLVPPNTPIRLDANCAWNLSECLDFWHHLQQVPLTIEYIEEPLRDPTHYPHIPFPFALDERLSLYADRLHHLPQLKALILKPSLLGFSSCIGWIKKASQHKLKAIISSTFESSIGLHSYAQLAALQPQTYAGLGTASWFLDDLIQHKATPQTGLLFSGQQKDWIKDLQWQHLSVVAHSGIDLP